MQNKQKQGKLSQLNNKITSWKHFRKSHWVAQNLIMTALLWLGVRGSEGAANVFCFIVWLTLFCAVICFRDPHARELFRTRGRSVPRWVDLVFSVGVTLALVYHGWFVTAIAYILLWRVSEELVKNVTLDRVEDKSVKYIYAVKAWAGNDLWYTGEFDRTAPPDGYLGTWEEAFLWTDYNSAEDFATEFGGEVVPFIMERV
jgi:hypothetical protein